jgi:glycopeptide antibiotics resistance protein
VFWIYLLLVVGVTLFPMPVSAGIFETSLRQSAADIFSQVNLIPLYYGHFHGVSFETILFREIIANIVLTMPFGFGIHFIVHRRAKHIVWLALGVGLAIETTQLVLCLLLGSSYRGVDINDVLMNALGVLLGYAFFRVFSWLFVAILSLFKIEPKGLFAYIHAIASRV